MVCAAKSTDVRSAMRRAGSRRAKSDARLCDVSFVVQVLGSLSMKAIARVKFRISFWSADVFSSRANSLFPAESGRPVRKKRPLGEENSLIISRRGERSLQFFQCELYSIENVKLFPRSFSS